MHIVSFLGSPRLDGNTAAALSLIEARLAESGAEVNRLNLEEMFLTPCQGCWTCAQSTDAPGCTQSDDMNLIYKAMIEADGIILATPLYCWSFSAQMKVMLDRSVALTRTDLTGARSSLITGKKAALVVTAAGGYENNADLIGPMFHRFCKYSGLIALPEMIITGSTVPDSLPPETADRAAKIAAGFLR